MRIALLCLLVTALAGLAQERLDGAVNQLIQVPVPVLPQDPVLPGADATLEQLAAYYGQVDGAQPSPAVRVRLVEAYERFPSQSDLLKYLPQDAGTVKRLLAFWQLHPSDALREWLSLRTLRFPEDLRKAAREGRDDAQRALLRLDRPAGLKLLRELAKGGDPGALAHLQQTQKLKALVTGPAHSGEALRALLGHPWPGFEGWYLARFQEPWGELLAPPVQAAPNRWLPHLRRFLQAGGVARENAVSCLLALKDRDREVAQALLPWIANPRWSKHDMRAWLLRSAGKARLPEAFPLILRGVVDDADGRQWHAEALGRYRDPKAVPALWKAWDRSARQDDMVGFEIVSALVACGGMTPERAVEGLRAWGADPEVSGLDTRMPLQKRLGFGLLRLEALPEDVLQAAWDEVKKSNSAELREALLQRESAATSRSIREAIETGEAGTDFLKAAMTHRNKLDNREAWQKMAEGSGARAGIAAAVLGDMRLLQGADTAAQKALLACASQARLDLPLADVVRLATGPTRAAAEQWLTARDTPATRQALQQLSTAIVGTSADLVPYLHQWEGRLRRELESPDGPREIFALLDASYSPYGHSENQLVLRVAADGTATVSDYDSPARYRRRSVSAAELQAFRQFLTDYAVDDLPAAHEFAFHPWIRDYVHLTPHSGRRVVVESIHSGWPVHHELLDRFRTLATIPGTAVHYDVLERTPGGRLYFHGTDDNEAVSLSGAATGGVQIRHGSRYDRGRDSAVRSQDGRWSIEIEDVPEDHSYPPKTDTWLVQHPEGTRRRLSGNVLPAADILTPMAWVEPHQAFLLVRSRYGSPLPDPHDVLGASSDWHPPGSVGPDRPEFYLYDPVQNACRPMEADMRPWIHSLGARLQAAGPDQVWVAMGDEEEQVTEIGRLNTRDFRFTPVMSFAGIDVDTDGLWVDEPHRKIYLLYRGDVLELPFPAEELRAPSSKRPE